MRSRSRFKSEKIVAQFFLSVTVRKLAEEVGREKNLVPSLCLPGFAFVVSTTDVVTMSPDSCRAEDENEYVCKN